MRRVFVLITVVAMVVVAAGLASAAPAEKVDVCHFSADSGTFHMINISENAYQKHLDHGDAVVGDAYPGMAHYVFGDDCAPTYVDPVYLGETIQVPGTGGHVQSSVLTVGGDYILKASGTYRFANWGEYGIADAHCNYRSASYGGPGWVHSASNYLEVWVDGAPFAWGPDNCPVLTADPIGHAYEGTVTGAGAALDFFIPDSCSGTVLGCYGDNSGFITVELWGWP
jgi:hypothetical protein